jgi:hypothetical protein
MQSNDMIEVVTPLGGGISEVTLLPGAAAVLRWRLPSRQQTAR